MEARLSLTSVFIRNVNHYERAKLPKGGDAKPRVYSRKAMIAGLPTKGARGPLGDDVQGPFDFGS